MSIVLKLVLNNITLSITKVKNKIILSDIIYIWNRNFVGLETFKALV